MTRTHDLTLTDSELADICNVVDRCQWGECSTRAFRVQGDLTDKTLDELCDEIETLAHEMRQAKHIRHATTIMHLAADAVVTHGANVKGDPR